MTIIVYSKKPKEGELLFASNSCNIRMRTEAWDASGFQRQDRIVFELSGRRKIMKDATDDRFFSLNPQPFKVVSIYDDADTRERALRLCDYLVKLLWEDAELKFSWWRTDFFRDDGL